MSCCRRRPGMRSTTCPRRTCTRSYTRSTRRSRRRGRPSLTGTRFTGSPSSSRAWPSATSAVAGTWSRRRCCMTRRMRSPSRWGRCATGRRASASRCRAARCRSCWCSSVTTRMSASAGRRSGRCSSSSAARRRARRGSRSRRSPNCERRTARCAAASRTAGHPWSGWSRRARRSSRCRARSTAGWR